MPGLRDEAGPVPEMFEVQGRPLLLRRVPEVRLAVSQADVQAVCCSWYAAVPFCWPGVGAVLISLWFFEFRCGAPWGSRPGTESGDLCSHELPAP